MALTRQRWLPFTSEISPQAVCRPDPDRIDYVFKIADCADELLQAYHLLYHEYLNAGYIRESPHKLLFTTHHLLPRTTVFLAKAEKTVLSTATLVHDSREFGLPMDALYTGELSALREQNRKVLEICSLASNGSACGRNITKNFTRLVFLYSVFRVVDDICIMVNPRHVAFYVKYFPFTVFGAEKFFPRVNAPAVPLRVNVESVRNFFQNSQVLFSVGQKMYRHYLSLKIGINFNVFQKMYSNDQDTEKFSNPLDAATITELLGINETPHQAHSSIRKQQILEMYS
ncbi:MAG TPA: hypothetical protein ENN39_05800 [Desulfonatronum sp.]|nr:hypothetical protein [Desulfonatronum sp.]